MYMKPLGPLFLNRRWPDLAPANKRNQSWLVEKLQCYESVNSNGKERSRGQGLGL